jgi:UDP-3-O-[3-hydroxymyristoyl] glucosamine N-acyltransferase
MPETTVAAIAEACGGTIEGEALRIITGANSLEEASASEVSFVANRRAEQLAASSHAGCLLVAHTFDNANHRTVVRVLEPRRTFARIVTLFHSKPIPEPGIHPTAVIESTAELGKGCSIGPHVWVGQGVHIGQDCVIQAGCSVGASSTIGDGSTLHPNVTLYPHVRLGNRVILHAGCVIGADGFGFAFDGERYEKFPQVGTVEIDDDVELGANCCVDRAALGVTRIGKGTKLDNMVHVAHNCRVGNHVVVAAQTGFSGGVTVGDYAVIGGQVGVGDKAKIEAKAIVGSGAGILTSKIVRAGEPVWGTPARPLKKHLQQLAAISKLPEMLEHLKDQKRGGRSWQIE